MFSSLVIPGSVSLYMQSWSPEPHSLSQSCTVCTDISTRPLSFAQMEQHINGRRYLHFLRKAFFHRMPSTKPAHRFRAHHAYAINTTAHTCWQEQSKSSSRTALKEIGGLQIVISQIHLLRSRASLWQLLLAPAREQWRHHQYQSVFLSNERRHRLPQWWM
jgi:hypothetical protein